MNKAELEKELEKFQLNPLQSSARNNLIKLVRIIGPLTLAGWQAFIRDDVLDLQELAKRSDISRSSLYQNKHIKKYILLKSEMLLKAGKISALPYQTVTPNAPKASSSKHKKDARSKSENAPLNSMALELETVKRDLKIAKRSIEFYRARDEYIFETGRMPY